MLHTPSGDPLPRVVTARDALLLGYSPGMIRTELRRGRWQQLTRGVYLTRGDLPTRADWISAGLAIAGSGALLSGWDAARAYGLGSERPPVDDVLVLAPDGRHRRCGHAWIRPSRRGVTSRRKVVAGLGVVSVAAAGRAVADTALVYRTLPPVRALVTSAVQQQRCTIEDLCAELDHGPRNGSAHLRRAIQDVLAGAASVSEAELAELMHGAGLPTFELNVPIVDQRGRQLAVADVLWRSLRAVLEVDSQRHHFLEPAWQYTMRRHNTLTRLDLAVTHYPPVDLRDRPEPTLCEIETWLRGRAASLGLPYPPPFDAAAAAARAPLLVHLPS